MLTRVSPPTFLTAPPLNFMQGSSAVLPPTAQLHRNTLYFPLGVFIDPHIHTYTNICIHIHIYTRGLHVYLRRRIPYKSAMYCSNCCAWAPMKIAPSSSHGDPGCNFCIGFLCRGPALVSVKPKSFYWVCL